MSEPWITQEWLDQQMAMKDPDDAFPSYAEATVVALAREIHQLRQERARHAREVEKARLEAKIEALAKFGECYCDGYDFTCDACLTQERARTALAALEGSK